jgi:hypothetical protein
MYTYRATTALPNAHRERAIATLRTQLASQVLADDAFDTPDWTTLSVLGPTETFTDRGEVCFEYRATVECRSFRERMVARAG